MRANGTEQVGPSARPAASLIAEHGQCQAGLTEGDTSESAHGGIGRGEQTVKAAEHFGSIEFDVEQVRLATISPGLIPTGQLVEGVQTAQERGPDRGRSLQQSPSHIRLALSDVP
jgi:hypothetical protein